MNIKAGDSCGPQSGDNPFPVLPASESNPGGSFSEAGGEVVPEPAPVEDSAPQVTAKPGRADALAVRIRSALAGKSVV